MGEKERGTGFVFERGTADALGKQVQAALKLMENEKAWDKIRQNAMGRDFSWERAVPEYEAVYERSLR
ncbi:MAG: glycogen synthase [Blastochloris sp.]|nr:glycogen synthase [Blastochloris sp.]